MTTRAQIDTLTTCKAISLPSVSAPVFTPETAGLDAAGRQATNAGRQVTGLELSTEGARHNKQQAMLVAVEATHSAFRKSSRAFRGLRSAKRNLASFEASHSATALSGTQIKGVSHD